MTRLEHFLTLIVFPIYFVIQWVTKDEVVSNYPIIKRGVNLTNTPNAPSGDDLISSEVILGDGVVSTDPVSSG